MNEWVLGVLISAGAKLRPEWPEDAIAASLSASASPGFVVVRLSHYENISQDTPPKKVQVGLEPDDAERFGLAMVELAKSAREEVALLKTLQKAGLR